MLSMRNFNLLIIQRITDITLTDVAAINFRGGEGVRAENAMKENTGGRWFTSVIEKSKHENHHLKSF